MKSSLQRPRIHAPWTSLRLGHSTVEATVDEFETPAVPAQLIVLLKRGGGDMERYSRGGWQRVRKLPGSVTLTAPGEGSRLRWCGNGRHEILHVALSAATMHAAAVDMRERKLRPQACPHVLLSRDPLIVATLMSLERASLAGFPDLYAETASQFLALHLLSCAEGSASPEPWGRDRQRLQRLDDYMRANLAMPLSLASLAEVANCSTFGLIRLCRAHWGETPFQRLTRLRMERAQYLLRHTDAEVISIALDCGYTNPSHFATAFRRFVGRAPSTFRRD